LATRWVPDALRFLVAVVLVGMGQRYPEPLGPNLAVDTVRRDPYFAAGRNPRIADGPFPTGSVATRHHQDQ
jgi:hypothetical protein